MVWLRPTVVGIAGKRLAHLNRHEGVTLTSRHSPAIKRSIVLVERRCQWMILDGVKLELGISRRAAQHSTDFLSQRPTNRSWTISTPTLGDNTQPESPFHLQHQPLLLLHQFAIDKET